MNYQEKMKSISDLAAETIKDGYTDPIEAWDSVIDRLPGLVSYNDFRRIFSNLLSEARQEYQDSKVREMAEWAVAEGYTEVWEAWEATKEEFARLPIFIDFFVPFFNKALADRYQPPVINME